MYMQKLWFRVFLFSVDCFLLHYIHLSTFSTLLIAFKKHIFLKHNEVVWLCLKKERERGGGRQGGREVGRAKGITNVKYM